MKPKAGKVSKFRKKKEGRIIIFGLVACIIRIADIAILNYVNYLGIISHRNSV